MTPLYPFNPIPASTPAEREAALLRENNALQMRVTVLSEALRAAEEELTAYRFGEVTPHATIHGVFNKREMPA